MFAELNVAIADAAIATADAKYTWWTWRPVTAIVAGGDRDRPMPDWTPLLWTPNHPGYVSGHAACSGAAATILTAWFGTPKFTSVGPGLAGVGRVFSGFQQAAEEAAQSRVFGGIHFPFENADGLATGRSVGTWTLAVFQRAVEERGPLIMLDPPLAAGGPPAAAVTGRALNNLTPVTALSARLGDRETFAVAVDERGAFALPARRLSPPGRHVVTLTATSGTGRTSEVRLEVETNLAGDTVGVPVLIR